MIPSNYVDIVAATLAHNQQASDNSSALANETAVVQMVIHHKAWIMLVYNYTSA